MADIRIKTDPLNDDRPVKAYVFPHGLAPVEGVHVRTDPASGFFQVSTPSPHGGNALVEINPQHVIAVVPVYDLPDDPNGDPSESITVQQDPQSMLWCVFDGGVFLESFPAESEGYAYAEGYMRGRSA